VGQTLNDSVNSTISVLYKSVLLLKGQQIAARIILAGFTISSNVALRLISKVVAMHVHIPHQGAH